MTDTPDGVLVVDKPQGITSHDVVAVVRRRLPRGTKVGHTGTLDPFATGVLPIVIGRATRLAQFLTATRKQYLADVVFGAATDSDDCTGEVIETVPDDDPILVALDAAAIGGALATLVGTHPQVPPVRSAKKVEGERAYDLARRGLTVTLPAVEVTAHALELRVWNAAARVAVVHLETSAGYYVRSLARDLGRRLGLPAHLRALRRETSGVFTLAGARTLGDVAEASPDQLRAWRQPMASALPDLPAIPVGAAQVDAVLHGQPIVVPEPYAPIVQAAARVRLLDEAGDLVGLARPMPQGRHLLHADVVLI